MKTGGHGAAALKSSTEAADAAGWCGGITRLLVLLARRARVARVHRTQRPRRRRCPVILRRRVPVLTSLLAAGEPTVHGTPQRDGGGPSAQKPTGVP